MMILSSILLLSSISRLLFGAQEKLLVTAFSRNLLEKWENEKKDTEKSIKRNKESERREAEKKHIKMLNPTIFSFLTILLLMID